ncbi:DNA repair protein XRCC4 isoform X2 [Phyllobates terribilis]|uniref:DNA repair protein XRCC4 isoform X2 n=1 Tax=Phyllobates terribilis TaxID=111132 RepID=UPI003CCB4F14
MERKVRKITIASKPEATYFLQIGWERELDGGFNVTLCDGRDAWIGEVTKEDLSKEAADMEMNHSKYMEELKKALITAPQTGSRYSFDLVKDEENPEMYCFTYEKTLNAISKENVTSTDLHCPFKGIEESKLSVNRKIVREYLANINEFKSPGPDELHPRVLKEIVEEILEPLSIIFENSWRTGEVPEDWRRANVVPIFKKGKKVDPGNYRPFKLGSLRLQNAADPAGIIKELIDYCLSCATEFHSRNEHLLKENERLRQDWNDMHEELDKFVSSKEELERGLYTRFTLVLNEKKAKIRSLNQKLSQTAQKVSEKSSSLPFDTLPIAEYSGSTDEESSEVKEETAPPSASRSQSLLMSPDDSPDIAPSRKRRQRGQKGYYTQMKHKPSQLGTQEDQRCKPGSSKATGKNPSSVNPPLPTSKSSPDPDDLFSDF